MMKYHKNVDKMSASITVKLLEVSVNIVVHNFGNTSIILHFHNYNKNTHYLHYMKRK
jgi:hypothetical protein